MSGGAIEGSVSQLYGKENFHDDDDDDDDDDEVAADRRYGCETSGGDNWVHSQYTGFAFHLAAATIEKKIKYHCSLHFDKK